MDDAMVSGDPSEWTVQSSAQIGPVFHAVANEGAMITPDYTPESGPTAG